MFLARIAVQKPVLATMVVGAFVVLGLFSYQRLVIDLFPRVEFPSRMESQARPSKSLN